MNGVRELPAETFAAVTARLGGSVRYIRLGRRLVLAWHVKEAGK